MLSGFLISSTKTTKSRLNVASPCLFTPFTQRRCQRTAPPSGGERQRTRHAPVLLLWLTSCITATFRSPFLLLCLLLFHCVWRIIAIIWFGVQLGRSVEISILIYSAYKHDPLSGSSPLIGLCLHLVSSFISQSKVSLTPFL